MKVWVLVVNPANGDRALEYNFKEEPKQLKLDAPAHVVCYEGEAVEVHWRRKTPLGEAEYTRVVELGRQVVWVNASAAVTWYIRCEDMTIVDKSEGDD